MDCRFCKLSLLSCQLLSAVGTLVTNCRHTLTQCCLSLKPLGRPLVKGNREPHETKKKSFDPGGKQTHNLRIRATATRVVPCFPLPGLMPGGLFMGLSSTIIYTSELVLCSTVCVPSAMRHSVRMCLYI